LYFIYHCLYLFLYLLVIVLSVCLLYCLSVFKLWLLITILVTSNFSSKQWMMCTVDKNLTLECDYSQIFWLPHGKGWLVVLENITIQWCTNDHSYNTVAYLEPFLVLWFSFFYVLLLLSNIFLLCIFFYLCKAPWCNFVLDRSLYKFWYNNKKKYLSTKTKGTLCECNVLFYIDWLTDWLID
jgi:hypothetical protein